MKNGASCVFYIIDTHGYTRNMMKILYNLDNMFNYEDIIKNHLGDILS